jgi:peptidyl-prolyl cis-trans isomerase A (cyclophilin A)
MFSGKKPEVVATFAPGAKVTATFETSEGTFVCSLFADKAPITVGSFVALARGEAPWTARGGTPEKKPLYDGTVFHRVIPEFMIQGGDPLGTGTGGPGFKYADEIVAGLTHSKPGTLSMANSGPNTNGSQFFVTDAATPWLDGKHTVFGEVTQGMEVVSKIAHLPCNGSNKPNKDVVLKAVRIAVA